MTMTTYIILILSLFASLTHSYGPYKSPKTIFKTRFSSEQKCEVQCFIGCDLQSYDQSQCKYLYNDSPYLIADTTFNVYECRCFDIPGVKRCHQREIDGHKVCIS